MKINLLKTKPLWKHLYKKECLQQRAFSLPKKESSITLVTL